MDEETRLRHDDLTVCSSQWARYNVMVEQAIALAMAIVTSAESDEKPAEERRSSQFGLEKGARRGRKSLRTARAGDEIP